MNLAKKNDWVLCKSTRALPGKCYYFNRATGEAAWINNDNERTMAPRPNYQHSEKWPSYPEPRSPPWENTWGYPQQTRSYPQFMPNYSQTYPKYMSSAMPIRVESPLAWPIAMSTGMSMTSSMSAPSSMPGPSGMQVPQSMPGPSGMQVPQSMPGPSIMPGPPGMPVAQSMQGPSGMPVPQSMQGPSGMPMPQSMPGPSGMPLAQSMQGPSGMPVLQSMQGPSGMPVPQSMQGPSGMSVPQSMQAPSGMPVPQSMQGPSGMPVPQSMPGPSGMPIPSMFYQKPPMIQITNMQTQPTMFCQKSPTMPMNEPAWPPRNRIPEKNPFQFNPYETSMNLPRNFHQPLNRPIFGQKLNNGNNMKHFPANLKRMADPTNFKEPLFKKNKLHEMSNETSITNNFFGTKNVENVSNEDFVNPKNFVQPQQHTCDCMLKKAQNKVNSWLSESQDHLPLYNMQTQLENSQNGVSKNTSQDTNLSKSIGNQNEATSLDMSSNFSLNGSFVFPIRKTNSKGDTKSNISLFRNIKLESFGNNKTDKQEKPLSSKCDSTKSKIIPFLEKERNFDTEINQKFYSAKCSTTKVNSNLFKNIKERSLINNVEEDNDKMVLEEIGQEDLRYVLLAKRKKSHSESNDRQANTGRVIKTRYTEQPTTETAPKKRVTFDLGIEGGNVAEGHEDGPIPTRETEPEQISTEAEVEPVFIVADLDVLLTEFHLLEKYVQAEQGATLLIPLATAHAILGATRGVGGAILQARRLARVLAAPPPYIMVQTEEKEMELNDTEDPALVCCWLTMEQGYYVVLITNNEDVYNKAAALEIECYTTQEIQSYLETLKQELSFDFKKIDTKQTDNVTNNNNNSLATKNYENTKKIDYGSNNFPGKFSNKIDSTENDKKLHNSIPVTCTRKQFFGNNNIETGFEKAEFSKKPVIRRLSLDLPVINEFDINTADFLDKPYPIRRENERLNSNNNNSNTSKHFENNKIFEDDSSNLNKCESNVKVFSKIDHTEIDKTLLSTVPVNCSRKQIFGNNNIKKAFEKGEFSKKLIKRSLSLELPERNEKNTDDFLDKPYPIRRDIERLNLNEDTQHEKTFRTTNQEKKFEGHSNYKNYDSTKQMTDENDIFFKNDDAKEQIDYKAKKKIKNINIYNLNELMKEFSVKTREVEDRILSKMEEYICWFIQIMEDTLLDILKDTTYATEETKVPLLSLLAPLREMYADHRTVRELADRLSAALDSLYCCSEDAVTLCPDLRPYQFMKILGYGILLVKCLLNNDPSNTRLQEGDSQLQSLLSSIESATEPQCDPPPRSPHRSPCAHTHTYARGAGSSDVEKRIEVLKYLQKHFPEWQSATEREIALYTESCRESMPEAMVQDGCGQKIFRTFGKDVGLLKFNSTKNMVLTTKDENQNECHTKENETKAKVEEEKENITGSKLMKKLAEESLNLPPKMKEIDIEKREKVNKEMLNMIHQMVSCSETKKSITQHFDTDKIIIKNCNVKLTDLKTNKTLPKFNKSEKVSVKTDTKKNIDHKNAMENKNSRKINAENYEINQNKGLCPETTERNEDKDSIETLKLHPNIPENSLMNQNKEKSPVTSEVTQIIESLPETSEKYQNNREISEKSQNKSINSEIIEINESPKTSESKREILDLDALDFSDTDEERALVIDEDRIAEDNNNNNSPESQNCLVTTTNNIVSGNEQDVSPNDSSPESENANMGFWKQAYALMQIFLINFSETFHMLLEFVKMSVSALRKDLSDATKTYWQQRVTCVETTLRRTIGNMKGLIDRESSEATAVAPLVLEYAPAQRDKRIVRYRQVVTKCLEQTEILACAIQIVRKICQDDFDLRSVVDVTSKYDNLLEYLSNVFEVKGLPEF